MQPVATTSILERGQDEQLRKEVSSIIDSRIQFLELDVHQLFLNNALQNNNEFFGSIEGYDQFMLQVKKRNRNIRFLHILRSQMTVSNLDRILRLLASNSYLDQAEDDLVAFLNRKNP